MTGKRIGIITLPGMNNYGNRLQLYAAVKTYEKIGYAAVSLEYKSKYNYLIHPKVLLRKLLGKNVPLKKEERSTKARIEAFKRFNSLFKTEAYEAIEDIEIDNYDYFSVGSDQVWNPEFVLSCCSGSWFRRALYYILDARNIKNAVSWYFLTFAPKEKRITFAPSIGISELDQMEKNILRNPIRSFNRISVREEKAAEVLKESFGVDCEVLSDPTIVLTAEEWRSVADDRLTPKNSEKYILTYVLGSIDQPLNALIATIAERKKARIVSLSDCQSEDEVDAGPAEFIDLIDNASCVITDSYHASIFAMILHTPLIITKRSDSEKDMFSRIETLAKKYDLHENIYVSSSIDNVIADNYIEIANNYIDRDSFIERERSKTLSYLNSCTE